MWRAHSRSCDQVLSGERLQDFQAQQARASDLQRTVLSFVSGVGLDNHVSYEGVSQHLVAACLGAHRTVQHLPLMQFNQLQLLPAHTYTHSRLQIGWLEIKAASQLLKGFIDLQIVICTRAERRSW